MNRLAVHFRNELGFVRISSFQKLVACPFQVTVHQVANLVFIFHQEHCGDRIASFGVARGRRKTQRKP